VNSKPTRGSLLKPFDMQRHISNSNQQAIMKLKKARAILKKVAGKEFSQIFTPQQLNQISNNTTNKGVVGQVLELSLGLTNNSNTLDFVDGELKTNSCDKLGKPKETVAITQISSEIDQILSVDRFKSSKLYKKITKLLFVLVYKEKSLPVEQWRIVDIIYINLKNPFNMKILWQLKRDYSEIRRQMKEQIEVGGDGLLHTANGKYLQIRTKDSAPYSPIFSNIYGREISSKNFAFYFQKSFVHELQK